MQKRWPDAEPSRCSNSSLPSHGAGDSARKGRRMNPRVQLILDELARHRHQFETFCRSLTEDELAAPVPASTWTVKDYVSHLGTIDGLIAFNFQRQVGIDAVPPPGVAATQPFDIDDWNEAAVSARRGATGDELLV